MVDLIWVCRRSNWLHIKDPTGSTWATTAEDPNGYHFSPLQIGKRGNNLQELTKIGQLDKDWKNVAWSDESRFLLRHSDGRVRIGRKQNENMDPSCLVTTVQAAGGDLMVWGMFSWHTLGPLVPIEMAVPVAECGSARATATKHL